ncbi:hypothetical protein SCLCIDRAFT_1218811, partial [Scleroderma citrinum Foug A]
NIWCSYKGVPPLTEVSDRYNTSITQRITLPPTPPNMSITLEQHLLCSTHCVPYIWSAHIQNSSSPARSTEATYPPQLVAKVFDPVFFDSYDAEYANPFILHNLSVSCEVEAYQRTDLCILVPPNTTENVCHRHKDAIINATLHVSFDILACSVTQMDMQPWNVILRPQQLVSGMQYCATLECPLRLEIDCNDFNMVMVDFEGVDFQELDTSFSELSTQKVHVENVKSLYLEKWLENSML